MRYAFGVLLAGLHNQIVVLFLDAASGRGYISRYSVERSPALMVFNGIIENRYAYEFCQNGLWIVRIWKGTDGDWMRMGKWFICLDSI